jgi:phosphoribosylformimino-5-aminoimidazole carboxamide ribotide isomerase
LKGGRCVRLVEGREESAKVYDLDPIEVARGYEQSGAELIHVVDLDGAFLGTAGKNFSMIGRIAEEISVPIEVGGGVRSLDDVRKLVEDVGARFVIIGTLAVEKPEVVMASVEAFGPAIVIGIDARDGRVATRGWIQNTSIDAVELAKSMVSVGVQRIIYTDIARDGKLEGPNFEMTRKIATSAGARVTASGGVSLLEDVRRLCDLESDGVDSVIIGKALYEKRFRLEEAIEVARQRPAQAPE